MHGFGLVLLTALAVSAQADSPRMRQYLGLAAETLRRPIRHEELGAALLSREGVRSIRAMFERSVAESLVVDGALVTPELGGEATLDDVGRAVFVSYPDPVHPIVREMLELSDEPSRLLEWLQSSFEGRRILSSTGGLHALLYQMAQGEPTGPQRELLERVLDGAVATHFKTWSTDPAIQARMIETTDWRGRYVGFWHIHPPRFLEGALAEGIEPSVPDMTQAIELGQFLTVVFQPDGFDAYDLSLLGSIRTPDLRRARVVQHRDPEWRPYFEALVRTRIDRGR